MGLAVRTNVAALGTYRNLAVTDGRTTASLEKLSSGYRINRAADDAAGLAISEGLRAQLRGAAVASRNIQDGISVVRTAEGALTEVHSVLHRMRDLSVQAANTGAMGNGSHADLQAEMASLRAELDRLAGQTTWNGTRLLDGSYATLFQVGGAAGDTLPVTIGTAVSAAGLGVLGVDVTTDGATYALTTAFPPAPGHAGVSTPTTTAGAGVLNFRKPAGTADFGGPASDVSAYEALDGTISFGGRSFDLASVRYDAAADTDASGTVDGDDLVAQLNAAATEALGLTVGPFSTTMAPDTLSFGVSEAVPGYTVDPTNAGIGLAVTDSAADRARATPVFAAATGAAAGIEALDAAIATVSAARADLGAVQNRLEHAARATGVVHEELAASESRIRDADMAQEMVGYTRNRILSDAGTAMLAQAVQVPRSLLGLLA